MGRGVRGTQPASFVGMPERRIESIILDLNNSFPQIKTRTLVLENACLLSVILCSILFKPD